MTNPTPIWDRLQSEANSEPKPEFLTIPESEVSDLADELESMGRLRFGKEGNEAHVRRGKLLVRGVNVRVAGS